MAKPNTAPKKRGAPRASPKRCDPPKIIVDTDDETIDWEADDHIPGDGSPRSARVFTLSIDGEDIAVRVELIGTSVEVTFDPDMAISRLTLSSEEEDAEDDGADEADDGGEEGAGSGWLR